jgi:hypothetical protein
MQNMIIDEPLRIERPKRYGKKTGTMLLIEFLLLMGLFITMYLRSSSEQGEEAWFGFLMTLVFLALLIMPLLALFFAWKAFKEQKTSRLKLVALGTSHLVILLFMSTVLAFVIRDFMVLS